MSFPRKDNFSKTRRKSSPTRRALLSVCVFVLVILVLNSFRPDLFSSTFQVVGKPFWLVKESTAGELNGFFSYFQSKHTLEAENASLSAELASQNLTMQNFNLLARENEDLKNILGRTDAQNLLLANVLQGPGSSPYDTFVLDVGSKNTSGAVAGGGTAAQNPVQVGDTVLLDGVLPIGSIKEIYPTTSLARLYSSPGEMTDVLIQGQKTLEQAIGMGDGNFEIIVPHSLSVPIGTHIILPGISTEFLGTIGDEESDITHATQTLYFRSDFNLNDVRSVFIDKGSAVVPTVSADTVSALLKAIATGTATSSISQ